ncbi:MAG: type II toxin-antitoxin system RelE/ParE family toxin [Hyphomonadaceae bacterium]|nr:type II toxin-antitoxin system RelE/ParE family toxin [Hyphomonadaceae bacterium]
MSRYLLSPAARADILEASRYGDATFGVAQTDLYFADLDRAMQLIAEFPTMARKRTGFRPPVRIHHHGSHYIVYTALKDHVRIVRVLSDQVDLGRHLRRIY